MSSRPSSVVLAACASWSSPLRGLSRLAIFCRPGGRSSGRSTRRPPARRNPCRPATAASCPVLRVLISLVFAVVRCCCLHSPLPSFAGCCPSVSADRAIVLHTITIPSTVERQKTCMTRTKLMHNCDKTHPSLDHLDGLFCHFWSISTVL
ncbi:hypothetical protein PF004_g29433, partial [Phytophthora fragariae]